MIFSTAKVIGTEIAGGGHCRSFALLSLLLAKISVEEFKNAIFTHIFLHICNYYLKIWYILVLKKCRYYLWNTMHYFPAICTFSKWFWNYSKLKLFHWYYFKINACEWLIFYSKIGSLEWFLFFYLTHRLYRWSYQSLNVSVTSLRVLGFRCCSLSNTWFDVRI